MNRLSETEDDLLRALGRAVQEASKFDSALQTAFCALVGSKYAAVVAAGQTTDWLSDYCTALAKVHRELAPEYKTKFLELLKEGKDAAGRRHRLVHDLWASGPNGTILLQRRRRTHEYSTRAWSLKAIESVTRDLTRATVDLELLLIHAFGPEAVTVEAQLRWEDYLASLSPEELAARVERWRQATLAKQQEAAGEQLKRELGGG
jgi:hypothetical protein